MMSKNANIFTVVGEGISTYFQIMFGILEILLEGGAWLFSCLVSVIVTTILGVLVLILLAITFI